MNMDKIRDNKLLNDLFKEIYSDAIKEMINGSSIVLKYL